jgi:5-methylcytosine-specific restriction endonuclease McrA
MHQALQVATFHLEHVVPLAVGGNDDYDNLALACPTCNLRKSDRTSVTDASTQTVVSLFNPRLHSWRDHFD